MSGNSVDLAYFAKPQAPAGPQSEDGAPRKIRKLDGEPQNRLSMVFRIIIRIHTCLHIYIYVYTLFYAQVCMNSCTSIFICYVYIYIYRYTQRYIHTCNYTYHKSWVFKAATLALGFRDAGLQVRSLR